MLYVPALALSVFIGTAGWYGWREYRSQQQQKAEAARPAPAVDPITQPWAGRIRAQKTLAIPAPIDGTLEAMDVHDGDDVFEGQLLAHIKNTAVEANRQRTEEDIERAKARVADFESQVIGARLEASRASANLARARSEYEIKSRQYERQLKLFREGAAARKTYEKSQADFEAASAELKDNEQTAKAADTRITALNTNLDEARKKLSELTTELEESDTDLLVGDIKSPTNGILIGHKRSVGEEVTRDITDLFEIATDLGALEVIADIPADLSKKLAPGGRAFVQIAEAGPAPLNATIKQVTANQAVVEFASPTPAIRPGMTAQVRFLN